MACCENVCTNPDCDWWDCSNERVTICPECGERVVNFFDEWPPWGPLVPVDESVDEPLPWEGGE